MLFEDQEIINTILSNKDNVVNSALGLKRGNMFNNEYITYKNLKEKDLIPTNQKSELLLKIYECDFAIIDLSLYLDLHSDNNEIYNTFKNYINEYKSLKEKYEKEYNLLCKTDEIKPNYEWINNPWPFDLDGGIKYV